ncbi:hypothetical protein K438DRAFT_1787409 [Mycena galopus ATCC 62051]|nr:hypothetical protein K438DRAFT_1787409 [Mycena galopus ATCC 62051]
MRDVPMLIPLEGKQKLGGGSKTNQISSIFGNAVRKEHTYKYSLDPSSSREDHEKGGKESQVSYASLQADIRQYASPVCPRSASLIYDQVKSERKSYKALKFAALPIKSTNSPNLSPPLVPATRPEFCEALPTQCPQMSKSPFWKVSTPILSRSQPRIGADEKQKPVKSIGSIQNSNFEVDKPVKLPNEKKLTMSFPPDGEKGWKKTKANGALTSKNTILLMHFHHPVAKKTTALIFLPLLKSWISRWRTAKYSRTTELANNPSFVASAFRARRFTTDLQGVGTLLSRCDTTRLSFPPPSSRFLAAVPLITASWLVLKLKSKPEDTLQLSFGSHSARSRVSTSEDPNTRFSPFPPRRAWRHWQPQGVPNRPKIAARFYRGGWFIEPICAQRVIPGERSADKLQILCAFAHHQVSEASFAPSSI